MWIGLLEALGGYAAAAAVVVFLGRKVIEHWFGRDLERYRTELQTEASIQLERLRATLERAAVEHQVRFSRVHERQAEVISEIFANLERAHMAFRLWTSPIQGDGSDMSALAESALECYQDFAEYFYAHGIWLDEDTCELIHRIVGDLAATYHTFANDVDERGFPRASDAWLGSWKKVSEDIAKARGRLDRRFRQILGVDGESVEPGVRLEAEGPSAAS